MVFCTNCQSEIDDSKYFLHEGFCKNNIRYCFKCKIKIPKEEFQEHLENHKITPKQEKKFETEEKTNNNKNDINVECQYCSLLVDHDEIEEHEKMCGARTVPCEICGGYVQTRLLNQHLNVIHDTGFKINNKNKEKEEYNKRKQIEEDEILARKLAEEYNRYDTNNMYNSYRYF